MFKARRRAIQVDTGTYLNRPSGDDERYADWLKSFDIETHKGEISELLVTLVEVRSLYTSLVCFILVSYLTLHITG